LEQGGQIQPKYAIYDNADSPLTLSSDTIINGFYIFLSNGNVGRSRSSYAPFDSNLVITYYDIKGNKYQIEESLKFNFRKNEFQYLIEKFPQKIK